MNNKGDLMKNVLGLVIAVIGIAIFIFAVAKLYNSSVSQEEQSAKNIADLLVERINSLDVGQEATFTFQGFKGANNWGIYGFDLRDAYRPEKCFLESCICVCNYVPFDSNLNDSGEKCQTSGFCREVSFENVDMELRTESVTRLVPGDEVESNAAREYTIDEPRGIPLNLFEMRVKIEEESLKITWP